MSRIITLSKFCFFCVCVCVCICGAVLPIFPADKSQVMQEPSQAGRRAVLPMASSKAKRTVLPWSRRPLARFPIHLKPVSVSCSHNDECQFQFHITSNISYQEQSMIHEWKLPGLRVSMRGRHSLRSPTDRLLSFSGTLRYKCKRQMTQIDDSCWWMFLVMLVGSWWFS